MNQVAIHPNWITPPPPPPTRISDDAVDLIKASIAPNTLRAYRRSTYALEAWLNGRTLDDGLLADYITELHHQGKAPSTIAQVVAAVRWHGKHHGIDAVGTITQTTLAGIRREGRGRGRGQVDGMKWNDVERICTIAEIQNTIQGDRDAAMIRLMSDCLLRISEAVAVNIEDFDKHTLTIETSKTDQQGRGSTLYVGDTTITTIRRYQQKAGIESGALFRRIRRGDRPTTERLTTQSARKIVKQRARDAGADGFISGHSLRVGSAISLAQAGATVVDMQTAGRWKSSHMPAHYAKAELAERGAIARFKYGK